MSQLSIISAVDPGVSPLRAYQANRNSFLKSVTGILLWAIVSFGSQPHVSAQTCGFPCPQLYPNLVANGNFLFPNNCGYTQFSSDYSHICSPGASPGTFSVTSNAGVINPLYSGSSHTADGSMVLFGRADGLPNKRIWYQNVTVTADKEYYFAAWLQSGCQGCGPPSQPTMSLVIKQNGVSYTLDTKSAMAWTELCGNFRPAYTGLIELSVVVMSPSQDFFYLDDIAFREKPTPEFTWDGEKCEDTTAFYSPTPMPSILTHTWKFGDGFTSALASPTHAYTLPGDYTVTHIINDGCYQDSVQKVVRIKCCCDTCGPELVTNGDFSGVCNTGYTSELAYIDCNINPLNLNGPGHYTERSSANTNQPNGAWGGTEHTGIPGSRMLLIDGPSGPGKKVAWKQTINVTPGTEYCFSAWVLNVCRVCGTLPGVELRIGGIAGTLIDSRDPIKSDTAHWTRLCGSFTASTSTIDLTIVVKGRPGGGNDLAIDDISFRKTRKDPEAGFQPFLHPTACNMYGFISDDRDPGNSHLWDFGDGFTSSSIDPDHKFPEGEGIYNVKHIVYNECGSDTEIVQIETIDCCCKQCGENLLTNGSFSDTCHTGYSSEMTYRDCANPGSLHPGFTEYENANDLNPGWHGRDHSGESGSRIMVIDGPRSNMGDMKVWYKKVKIEPGNTYCFSAYAKTICSVCPNPPTMELWIGDEKLDSARNMNDTLNWRKMCHTFTADEQSPDSIELKIIIKGKGSNSAGNDAALDDISFTNITPPVSSFIYSTPSCGQAVGFTASQSGVAFSQFWDFGDGSTSTLAAPEHVFPRSGGIYNVKHRVVTACDTAETIVQLDIPDCCCDPCGDEILANGGFTNTQCFYDYSSELTPTASCNATNLGGNGHYTENSTASFGGWAGQEHTGVAGSRMMLIDGPTAAAGDKAVWYKTISVKEGSEYCFSAWVLNVCKTCGPRPGFYLAIDDTELDKIDSVRYDSLNWTKLCGSFIATGPDVMLKVMMIGRDYGAGNDAALDDISLKRSGPPVADFIYGSVQCNIPVTFTSDETGTNVNHQWDFGDGHTSASANPTHAFPQGGGAFPVKHIVTDSCGADTFIAIINAPDCCCQICKPSLVTNGDFSGPCPTSAPFGFRTDLYYNACSSSPASMPPGMVLGQTAQTYNTAWKGFEHTHQPGSKAMIIDGPVSTDNNKRAWFSYMKVKPNTTYCFSAWVKPTCGLCPNPPSFDLKIGGLAGIKLDSTRRMTDTTQWRKLCGMYTTPSVVPDSLEIDIVILKSVVSGSGGNDAMLDDISFSEQAAPDANFTFSEPKCTTAMQFSSKEDHSSYTHNWDFGDQTNSALADPVHIYTLPGTYSVTHTAINPCGTSVVSKVIYVKCCCDTCGPNLVRNGNFAGSCKTEYSSDMEFKNCNNPPASLNPGFAEATNAQPYYSGNPDAWRGQSHDSGTRFLLIDGPTDENKRVWFQKVQVVKGKRYCFSAWVKNICAQCADQPGFELRINGKCGELIDSIVNIRDTTGWVKLCGEFTPAYTGPAELDVIMLKGSTAGNDGGVDDINLSEKCDTCQSVADATFTMATCPLECGTVLQFTSKMQSGVHTWDFGDLSAYGTTFNPAHIYTLYGNQMVTVTHTVFNGCTTAVYKMNINLSNCQGAP